MQRVRELMRQGRGQSLACTIQTLNPLLRGWANYFRLSVQHKRMRNLDGWVRRRLRCLLWRQWKRPRARQRYLLTQGLDSDRAWKSSVNGRGPWWNAGASHMEQAYPNAWFQRLGLVSIHKTVVGLQRIH
ncbi:group II intron maturase-specific domain-containing protein [Allopusillimonas ginsengisoli]|uniref:group II intron maturase-specific domain-containing protein n=1 Tax=Allopusillimonas ginsengisoli TaxID=453575 RepID=UPI001FD67382|nr:group II intron maturase-specific domain-containing protein [Allopusillimonas ginsengisoli]